MKKSLNILIALTVFFALAHIFLSILPGKKSQFQIVQLQGAVETFQNSTLSVKTAQGTVLVLLNSKTRVHSDENKALFDSRAYPNIFTPGKPLKINAAQQPNGTFLAKEIFMLSQKSQDIEPDGKELEELQKEFSPRMIPRRPKIPNAL